jgi:hypothetical protein
VWRLEIRVLSVFDDPRFPKENLFFWEGGREGLQASFICLPLDISFEDEDFCGLFLDCY